MSCVVPVGATLASMNNMIYAAIIYYVVLRGKRESDDFRLLPNNNKRNDYFGTWGSGCHEQYQSRFRCEPDNGQHTGRTAHCRRLADSASVVDILACFNQQYFVAPRVVEE